MKAFLILEDGHVFTGTSIGSAREVISEIVFNTSMTGYLEVMTDPSYAGQAVCMTYPLIGNYGICCCKSLTSITIPNNVTSIGYNAFSGCESLKEVIFKGKTLYEVKKMNNYPFGIEDESIIKYEI